MTPQHDRLTDLPEAQLIWLARFADTLRRRSAVFAADDAGTRANEIARNALESPHLNRLPPEEAAARWLADSNGSHKHA